MIYIICWCFMCLDAGFTLCWWQPGLEANPLMEALLLQGPHVFLVGKLTLSTLCLLALYKGREHPLGALGLLFTLIGHGILVLVHLPLL